MSKTYSLSVNGQTHAVVAAANTPLLYLLRNDLQLKGTRFGCGSGACGACHVLIDGRKATSCDTPVWAAVGKRITTIEGLGQAGNLHALQQAFIDEQAAQCGYCANGIIITAQDLLTRNPHPTEAEVRTALDGNLCRCGTHNRIVKAILKVAA